MPIHFNQIQFLKDLEALVNIESYSYDSKGLQAILDFLQLKCEKNWKIQFHTIELHSNTKFGGFITNTLEKTYDILFVTHSDTVFPKGTINQNPFSVQGEHAYGPGIADMKSGLLLACYVLDWIQSNQFPIKIALAINPNEEIGSKEWEQWLIDLGKKSQAIFVFEPSRKNANIIIQRKGSLTVKIEFHGISAHSGNDPQAGASTTIELAKWIASLYTLNNFQQGTTLNFSPIKGGNNTNVIPNFAQMFVELRYCEPKILKQFHLLCHQLMLSASQNRIHVTIETLSQKNPYNPSAKTLIFYNQIKILAKNLNQPIHTHLVGGVSDANTLSHLPIPILDAMGPSGENFHTSKEYLRIKSLASRFQLLIHIIKNFKTFIKS